MSRKLDSILNTMPPATVGASAVRVPIQEEEVSERGRGQIKEETLVVASNMVPILQTKQEPLVVESAPKQTEEKMDRIVAMVPYSLKREIKQYLVDHPGDTEKTVLLKGLMALGFKVSEEYLEDLRGKKSIK